LIYRGESVNALATLRLSRCTPSLGLETSNNNNNNNYYYNYPGNAGLQAVAVQGAHRGYELKQADVTCSVMTELSVINMRRLFANRGVERMNLAKEGSGSSPRLRKTTNAVMDM
jgi:hypothetical protein